MERKRKKEKRSKEIKKRKKKRKENKKQTSNCSSGVDLCVSLSRGNHSGVVVRDRKKERE